MKKISNAIAAFCTLFCSTAHAATFSSIPTSSEIWSLYVNPQELDNGFDTVIFDAVPTPGFQFSNVTSGNLAGVPRPAGQSFTYRNRMLDADPTEVPGGLAWTTVGVTQTADRIGFTAGPLGSKIDTTTIPPGLFLANFVMVPGNRGLATLQLVNAGTIVFQAAIPIIEPEPSSSCLIASALVPLAVLRRRVT